MVDGVSNSFFSQNHEIKLQKRSNASGITVELKCVFDELAKQGIIKDKDGEGLTKKDALNLYNMLNNIHKNTNRSTNYSSMQDGQSFTYTAEEMKALAQAAGYEIVDAPESQEAPLDGGMLEEVVITAKKPKPANIASDMQTPAELEIAQNLSQTVTENQIEQMGGKIIEREVNGQKQQIAVVEIDGQKVRRAINQDGTLGENLVTVSTFGKNKYVTQSKFDADVRTMLGLGANDEIPQDLKAEYVTIGGESSIVIKKDGKVMDSSQIHNYMAEYNKSGSNLYEETFIAHNDPPPTDRGLIINDEAMQSQVYEGRTASIDLTTGERGPIINEEAMQSRVYQGRTAGIGATTGDRGLIINDAVVPPTPATPVQDAAQLDNGEQVKQNQEPVKRSINNGNAVGNYSIVSDGHGGYKVDAHIYSFDGGDAKAFFKTLTISGRDYAEEGPGGMYSFRGVSSNSRQGLERALRNISNQVSMNNAVYKDLLTRQQNGDELSAEEKKFMQDHVKNLEQYNLGVDAQGNLIDTTPQTRRGRRNR